MCFSFCPVIAYLILIEVIREFLNYKTTVTLFLIRVTQYGLSGAKYVNFSIDALWGSVVIRGPIRKNECLFRMPPTTTTWQTHDAGDQKGDKQWNPMELWS